MTTRTQVHMAGRVLGGRQYCAQCGVALGVNGGPFFPPGSHVQCRPDPHAGRVASPTDDPVDCHR